MRSAVPIDRRSAVAMMLATALPLTARAGQFDDPPSLVGFGGQYTMLRPVRQVATVPVQAASGDLVELGRFAGRVVLLNFWATWCAPCVREMPSLDRLAAKAPADLAIVPVSVDRDGRAAVERFQKSHRLARLDMYFNVEQRTSHGRGDASAGVGFGLYGLPISYVIDRASYARGYIAGAVDWDSDEAAALLRFYGQGPAG